MLETFLKLLLDEELVHGVLWTLSVGGPIFGLLAGVVAGISCGRLGRMAVRGLALGLLGTLLGAMWLIYTALTNHFGLDSVKNLLINGVIFVCTGLVVSWTLAKVFDATR